MLDRKRRGELSELAFIYKATRLGFRVCKPYGESDRYDFVVEHRGRLSKIQVKSTTHLHRSGCYFLDCSRRNRFRSFRYLPGEVDFFAIHIVPIDVWYIIPLAVLGSKHGLVLYPHLPKQDRVYGACREAWHLLEGFAPDTEEWVLPFPISIDACAEEPQSCPTARLRQYVNVRGTRATPFARRCTRAKKSRGAGIPVDRRPPTASYKSYFFSRCRKDL